jgi:hypothetical protein
MLQKVCDENAVQRGVTISKLIQYLVGHKKEVSTQPCHIAHWGFCRARDAEIAHLVKALVAILSHFAKSVLRSDEGKQLLMFSSVDGTRVAFFALGKINRSQGILVRRRLGLARFALPSVVAGGFWGQTHRGFSGRPPCLPGCFILF